jgi:ATP-dependent Zn protease
VKWNKSNTAISAALICAIVVWSMVTSNKRTQATVNYSEFFARVRAGQVASVIIEPSGDVSLAFCRLRDGTTVKTVLPRDYHEALAAIQDKQVNIEIRIRLRA